MKINNFGTSSVNPYQREMQKMESFQTKTGKATDKIEISSEAIKLQQQQPIEPSRQEKIAAIKASVEKGSYDLNPQQIAVSVYNYHVKNK
ncbi:flagellar biosynthesis anti-sigma factor FlgM [Caldibacillus lycopersici]|uniref:Negative regulator of flagellin synthesis n=1 Tax=Perspicuibacillus lycopersici TaxID=1325689 RepID=A0AAE3LMP7_9BACI|nr:flagellar biosynthesis anti-sigma factor FlgM [Perspicuibacillus lycopersici]MCU9612987.1 flagellar biosynthesis anti-sigma factor FlgM [Perspicuibacillus lycopersici]